jgi:hypothetical protein
VQIGCQFLNMSAGMQDDLARLIERMNSRNRR